MRPCKGSHSELSRVESCFDGRLRDTQLLLDAKYLGHGAKQGYVYACSLYGSCIDHYHLLEAVWKVEDGLK